jgi:hypothetical protein
MKGNKLKYIVEIPLIFIKVNISSIFKHFSVPIPYFYLTERVIYDTMFYSVQPFRDQS